MRKKRKSNVVKRVRAIAFARFPFEWFPNNKLEVDEYYGRVLQQTRISA